MKININLITEEKLWLNQDKLIAKRIKSLLKKIIPQTPLQKIIGNIEISVLLTGDKKIQELNKNYRNKNKATNVLSFPLLDSKKIKNGNLQKLDLNNELLVLGDIILSYKTIKKEAEEQNKNFDDHLTHLLIHSLLHLIGFDHENSKDAKIMEGLEIKILSKMKIKNPYLIS